MGSTIYATEESINSYENNIFNYQELKDSEIRLMSFKPIRGDNRLEFDIHHYERKAAPPYSAISYTWGNYPSATKLIYLNGKQFFVRPNLWNCLYNLAGHCGGESFTVRPEGRQAPSCERIETDLILDRPTTDIVCQHFWVDAICINQENNGEKSRQVIQMDRIFGNAAMVSVWLGSVEDDVVEDPDWLDRILDLATRQYWRRLWIVQEILLARHIVIFLGRHYLSWKEFETLIYRKQARLRAAGIPWAELGAEAFFAEQFQTLEHSKPQLYNYLVKYSDCACKDPRDKIFGLLGLLSFQERAKIGRYLPDYSLSHEQVVIIVLAHLDRQTKGAFNLNQDDRLRQALVISSPVQWIKLCSRSVKLGRLWELEDESGGLGSLWGRVVSRTQNKALHRQWRELRGRSEGAVGLRRLQVRFIIWLLTSLGYRDARQLQWSLW